MLQERVLRRHDHVRRREPAGARLDVADIAVVVDRARPGTLDHGAALADERLRQPGEIAAGMEVRL